MSGRDRKIQTSIKYTSSNGFTGILYGENSLSIGKVQADGSFDECFHTESRNGNSIEYLKEMVDDFPIFMEAMEELRTGLDQEEEGDDE